MAGGLFSMDPFFNSVVPSPFLQTEVYGDIYHKYIQ